MELFGANRAQALPLQPRLHHLPAFRFSVDGEGHTVLACGWKQRLIVSGDHLTRRCDQWLVRRELEQGGARRWLELYNQARAHRLMPLLDLLSGVLSWLLGLPALLAGLYALVALLKPVLLIVFGLALFLLIE